MNRIHWCWVALLAVWTPLGCGETVVEGSVADETADAANNPFVEQTPQAPVSNERNALPFPEEEEKPVYEEYVPADTSGGDSPGGGEGVRCA